MLNFTIYKKKTKKTRNGYETPDDMHTFDNDIDCVNSFFRYKS